MAEHQLLLALISLMSNTCKQWQTFLQLKSLRRHVHGYGVPFLSSRAARGAISYLGNPLPWGNSRIAETWQSHVSATQSQVFLWVAATVAVPEEWLCLGSCHVLRSLVVMFPRGIHCCVTKPGAIWDHLDVGVESTTCKGNEMAV